MEYLSFLWHRYALYLYAVLLIVLIAFMMLAPRDAASDIDITEGPLTGWIWSDTIGWISLNCEDIDVCPTSNYQVVRAADGKLSGYAWSDTLGWITFNINESSGCPQTQVGNTSCTPSINSGVVNGWARACSGMNNLSPNQTQANDTCTNEAGSRTDGWDGWISLRGSSPQAYGPVVDDDGLMSGFGWGGNVVGWASTTAAVAVVCTPELPMCEQTGVSTGRSGTFDVNSCQYVWEDISCPFEFNVDTCTCVDPTPSCTVSASPEIVTTGDTVMITWSSSDATSCTVSGNDDSWSGLGGTEESNHINGQTIYTVTCKGLDFVTPNSCTTIINPSPGFREL